jgi:glycosyltransferase involved in cell wall biosynthesis
MPRLAYLVSHYPALSHTFILREIRRLRDAGFELVVASINAPDRPDAGLTAEEREEAAATYYVKRAGVWGALAAHLATLGSRPWAWLRGLAFALHLGGKDLKRLLYSLFYFVEAVMVGRWMQRQGMTHLHVHFAMPASTVALIATKIYPITFSITVHGPDEFYDVPGYRLAEKVSGASFVCCIGHYARSQMMRLSDPAQWSKFEVSPLGVDAQLFAPRPFREHPQPFEVLCVGRVVPAKGQHILIHAMNLLADEGRNVRLRVVGDGPDRASLEQLVARLGLTDRIVFEGAVNQDRIRELYAKADAFALASFAEGIPVVLMEAMAMEIPCVTTFITGHPELIRHGIDGLLVAPSDDTALAKALAALMDDPTLRRELGEAGRRRVLDAYHLDRNTMRLASIFCNRLGIGGLSNAQRGNGTRKATHQPVGSDA